MPIYSSHSTFHSTLIVIVLCIYPCLQKLTSAVSSTFKSNVQNTARGMHGHTMARPILKTCCLCQSLRTGSIITGILGILLAIASLIVMFVTRVEFRTILLDWLDPFFVKIILAINLCMTILISILLIVGVVKRNHYLMLPWVVLGIILAVGLLISVIWTSVVFLIEGWILAGCLWLIFGLISVVIYVYMWMVVYSYFTTIREDNNRGRYNKQPYRR